MVRDVTGPAGWQEFLARVLARTGMHFRDIPEVPAPPDDGRVFARRDKWSVLGISCGVDDAGKEAFEFVRVKR